MKPSKGRIVFYVLADGPRAGEVRAAIVTSYFDGNTHPSERCNLHVFLDGSNDSSTPEHAYSAEHDEETKRPGTWHWPPRV